MDPEIKVEFRILGEIPPYRITDLIGINPSRIWSKGESIQNSKLIRKQDGWCLESNIKYPIIDIETYIKDILVILMPKAKEIIKICNDFELHSEFACLIDIINKTPILVISPETLLSITRLNAGIDIDIVLTE